MLSMCCMILFIETSWPTFLAPPPNLRIVASSRSIDFSIFLGSHSSHSPTDTPLLISQDLGELEGAKTGI